jgi:hypothetical protein
MKPKFVVGMVVLAAAIAAPSAKALTITTPYQSFSWTQGTTPTRTPSPLTFATFNSLSIPSNAILRNVSYKLAGDSNGSGNASVAGRIRVNNASSPDPATVTEVTYDLKLQFANSVQLTKATQSTTSLSCAITVSNPQCTPSGTSVVIAAETATSTGTTDAVLNGAYSGQSNPFGLSGSALSMFQTGTTISTVNAALNNYFVTFAGVTDNTDTTFNLNSGTLSPKANMFGFIALEYDYDVPAGTGTPGPVPLIGAAAAFGWSRRLKKRISSAA